MAKKKKNQEGLEAPANDGVFPEADAARGAAQQETAKQEAFQTAIPSEVAELIKATLTVVLAQRKLSGLATTVTSLTRVIYKALGRYVERISASAVREFVKKELENAGYRIITAKVEYMGVRYEAETVILYRSFEELIDMVKDGKLDSLRAVIINDGIDPIHDKMIKL
jgi:hypothetical protein